MHKKEYRSPELTFVEFRLRDVICSSTENYGSQINQGGFDVLPSEDDFDDIID